MTCSTICIMSPTPDSVPKNYLPRWCYKALLLFLFIGSFLIWIKSVGFGFVLSQISKYIISDRYLIQNKLKKLKYMLLWTPASYAPFHSFGIGYEAFVRNKCPISNCYVTARRDFFDITRFDAIAFNGRHIASFTSSDLPKKRSLHQKYIYFNMESADYYPVCSPIFDHFFNWTSTYKLNSDIVSTYFLIRNVSGKEIGPRRAMTWKNFNEGDVVMKHKVKAVAWMASNCNTRSKREDYVYSLKKALKFYNQTIDIYGACGTLTCPKYRNQCDVILREKYYFYLSFENSLVEDYVTEKLYVALKNNVVPIVMGGANYSRFLPPGSYLNAMEHSPEKLAAVMVDLMHNPGAYSNFFKWKTHYIYQNFNPADVVCRVCAALNNKTMIETHSIYEDFRGWWHPKHEERCKEKSTAPGNKRAMASTRFILNYLIIFILRNFL